MADLHQADMLIPVQESKENKLNTINIRDLRGVFLEEYLFDKLNPKPVLGEHQYGFYYSTFGLWIKIPNFNSFTKFGEALVDLNSGKQYKVLRSPMDILEVRGGKLKLDSNKYYLGEVYHFTVDQVEFATFRLGNQTLTLYRSPGTEGHWLPLTEDRLRELGRKGYLDLSKLGYKTHKIKGTTESLVEITKRDPKVEVRVIEYNKLTKLEDLLKQLSLTKQSNSSSSDQKKDKAYELYREGERTQYDKPVSTQSKGQRTQQGKDTPVPASQDQKKGPDKASGQQEKPEAKKDQRLDTRQTIDQSKGQGTQQGKHTPVPASQDQKKDKAYQLYREGERMQDKPVSTQSKGQGTQQGKSFSSNQKKDKAYELYRQGERMQYDKPISTSPDQKLEVQPSEKEKSYQLYREGERMQYDKSVSPSPDQKLEVQSEKESEKEKSYELYRQGERMQYDKPISTSPDQKLEVQPSEKEKSYQLYREGERMQYDKSVSPSPDQKLEVQSEKESEKEKSYELYRQGERMQYDKPISTSPDQKLEVQPSEKEKSYQLYREGERMQYDKSVSPSPDQKLEVQSEKESEKEKSYELYRQGERMQYDKPISTSPDQKLEVQPSEKEKSYQLYREGERMQYDKSVSPSPDQKLEVQSEKESEKEKSYELYRQGERMQYDKPISTSPDQKLEVQPSEKEKNEQQDKLINKYPKESELNRQGNETNQLNNVGTTTQPIVSQDQIEQAKQYLREIGMRESQISSLMIGYQQLLERGYDVRLEQYLAYVESIESTPEEFGPKFRSALEQLLKDIRSNSIKTSSGFIQFMEKTKETELPPQSKSDSTSISVVSQDQIEQAKQYLREIGMRESQISSLIIGYQQLLERGYDVRLEQYLAYVESIQATPEEFGLKFRSALEQLLKDIRSNSIKTSSGFIQFMEKTKETELPPQSKSDNTQSQIGDNESDSPKQSIEQPSAKEEIMEDTQTKPELESQTTTNQETQILIDRVEDIIQQIRSTYDRDLITERRNEIIQRINRLTPNEVKVLLEIMSKLDKLKEIDREVLLDIIANPNDVSMQRFEAIARKEGEINQELKDFYYLVRLFYENLTEQQYLGMMKYYFRGE